ncbi:hypothetical protein CBR_g5745 [Chara braunii]|uniref:rRNA adenine N(6)-methyltransferase n=1 Tax=Chara braunii TaxID=69332 RepID=A0A388KJ75_CHABU|nr:hypothetical protein CBR_g5745 [Chara braunii]|eukprot:GBG70115.1 hypothetical protein CBR_g5745 [Chara braunii]
MAVVAKAGCLTHSWQSLQSSQIDFQVPPQKPFKVQHDLQACFIASRQRGAVVHQRRPTHSLFVCVPTPRSHADCDQQLVLKATATKCAHRSSRSFGRKSSLHSTSRQASPCTLARALPGAQQACGRNEKGFPCVGRLSWRSTASPRRNGLEVQFADYSDFAVPWRTRLYGNQWRKVAVCQAGADSQNQQTVTITRLTVKTLREYGAQPRKGLGQHFMINDEVNVKLVDTADIVPGDVVLEVGPGTGTLTERLLHAGALVLAVEKDAKMMEALRSRFANVPEVELVLGDILKWDIRYHLSKVLSALGNSRRAKIVSNMPFNITSEFLMNVIPMGDLFSTIVLLVQEETARRLVDSGPGDSGKYRQANVMLRFFGEPEYIFSVSRKCFFPQPKVDAAILKVTLRTPEEYPVLVSSHSSYPLTLRAFTKMVASAFQGKRKMLKNSLKSLYSLEVTSDVLNKLELPSTARPEELSLDDFVRIFNAFENTRGESKVMAEMHAETSSDKLENSEQV